MSKLIMVEALNQALIQEMTKDRAVMVMGEDVGKDGGVFRVTEGLLKKFGEDRCVDTPLAESGIVGTAIGLAAAGFKPVVEVQFAGFLYSAFDQLVNHAARMRWRTRGKVSCPLVVRSPYGAGVRALEHHSESMEALFVHVPGLKVVIPATPYEAKGLLVSAMRDPDPVMFLEPTRVYRALREEVPEKEYTLPLGQAHVEREGKDVTVIAWGAMMREVKKTVESLQEKYSCEVLNLRTLSPLDTDTIISSVKKTGRCVIVHEAPRTSGFGAEVSAQIMEKALVYLEAPVERVTGFDTIVPLAKLESKYIPDEKRIAKAIEKVMAF